MDLNDTPEQAEYRAEGARAGWTSTATEAPAGAQHPGRGRGRRLRRGPPRAGRASSPRAGSPGVTWPAEFGGQGLGPLEQVIVNQEIGAAGVPGILDVIGVGMLGPTIIAHGTDEQKQRYLGPMLHGDEVWCQLFSEPAAGSDLAGDPDARHAAGRRLAGALNGQKVWTTNAQFAAYGLLLARTDADVAQAQGPDDVHRARWTPRASPSRGAAPDLRRGGVQRGLLRRRQARRRRASSGRSTAAGARR